VVAIVPAHLPSTDDVQDFPEALPYLAWWVRGLLVVLAVGLTAVFATAAYLNPYTEDGAPRTMETHRQLGLPPCTFKTYTGGMPCPSCGMTTSFALLIHGDPVNSLRANWVGTLLALFWLALIPWSLVSVWLRRPVLVVSLERALSYAVVTFLVLMLLRWAVVLALFWWERRSV
jgi:hypothetical protein